MKIYLRHLNDGKPTTYELQLQKCSNIYNQFQKKGRGNCCFNLRKKRKQKTKKLSKITAVDKQKSSVQ